MSISECSEQENAVEITGTIVGPGECAIKPRPYIGVEVDTGEPLHFHWTEEVSTLCFNFKVPAGTRVCVHYPTRAGANSELVRQGPGVIEFQACGQRTLPSVMYESAPGLISGKIEREVLRGGEVCWAPLSGVPVEVFDTCGKRVASPAPTDCEGLFQFSNPGKDQLILRLHAEIESSNGPLVLKDHEISVLLECTQSYTQSFELCPIHYCLARSEVVAQVTDGTGAGLEGARVSLTYRGGACLPAQERQTDEYGTCCFPDLLPGRVEVSVPTRFRDCLHKSWELPQGQSNQQCLTLVGRVSQTASFAYQEEEHNIVWTVLSNSMPVPDILVEVRDSDGDRVIDRQRTDQTGTVNFNVSHEGEYEIRVYDDERVTAQPLRYEHVLVHSTARGTSDIAT